MQPTAHSPKILYLDCATGVSGDMILGALIDLGVDPDRLRARLRSLGPKGYTIASGRTRRHGIAAAQVQVKVRGRQPERGEKEIRAIVEKSDLPDAVKSAAMAIVSRIVTVEAAIHGIPKARVHLHEIGAIDSIVDIVGAVIGFSELLGLPGTPGAGSLVCSPLNVGHGTVRTEHGVLPVPAPATAALLKDVPIYSEGPAAELVTPTGAAIVTHFAASYGPPPPMLIERVGYGAGARDFDGRANVLRAILGRAWGATTGAKEVLAIECTIDDMNPQGYGYLMERLFDAGALEVFYTPVQMKKDRPGVLVTLIAPAALLNELARVLFEESTTIGLRYRTMQRIELARETKKVRTRYGVVRVKISTLDGRVTQAQPEYEDCRRLAARRKVPLKVVQAAAAAAWEDAS